MAANLFDGKRILITGGTGSMGKVLVNRLLSGEMGEPATVIVYSRDEAKQYFMRVDYEQKTGATDEVIYRNFQKKLQFWIGDVRDLNSVASALRDVDIVVNAAAMKQVPTCEYYPYEAVRTNIYGERAFRYCQHDVGHAIGAARLAAATLGWNLALLDGTHQATLASLIGVNRDEDFAGAEREHRIAWRSSGLPAMRRQFPFGLIRRRSNPCYVDAGMGTPSG